MKYSAKKSVSSVALLTIFALLVAGCASIDASRTGTIASDAKLIIMPPRDVVQGGSSHPVGQGSGARFQRMMQNELANLSSYEIVLFQANDALNHETPITREDALRESLNAGADYCLILELGEFRDAAPMTFRSDFVTLQSGSLVDVKTKQDVWSLNQPFRLEGDNLGNYQRFIDKLAKSLAESIVRN